MSDSFDHHDVEILQKLTELTTLLQAHIEEEKTFRPKLDELIQILERSKGVMSFVKFCIYVGAPVSAAIYWIKEHVKL